MPEDPKEPASKKAAAKKPAAKKKKAPPGQRGGGKPAHVPTSFLKGQVAAYASCGASDRFIAKEIGVDVKTLEKYYSEELAAAPERSRVKGAQILQAMAFGRPADPIKGTPAIPPNVKCLLFWMERRHPDFRPVTRVENTGVGGGPIEIAPAGPVEVDLTALTDEELDQYAALHAKAKEAGAARAKRLRP